jgi:hypothetical protein
MAIIIICRRTESISTVLRIVKLYYTTPNLVSYQKVLNKSRNFSSRRKFSQTVFACREIKKKKKKKKKKVREPPRSINWARAKTHDRGFALKLRVRPR